MRTTQITGSRIITSLQDVTTDIFPLVILQNYRSHQGNHRRNRNKEIKQEIAMMVSYDRLIMIASKCEGVSDDTCMVD
jgi:hypothetical protein